MEYYLDKQEKFFRDHIIIHTHIPKCAGSSLISGLRSVFGEESIVDTRRLSSAHLDLQSIVSKEQLGTIKVLSGHFWHGSMEKFFDRKPVYIASVREPISKFISLYNFVLKRQAGGQHPLYDKFKDMGIEKSAQWYFKDPTFANEMKFALGLQDAEEKIISIQKNYAVVVPHSSVNALINGISLCLTGNRVDDSFNENSAPKKFDLMHDSKLELRKFCSNDIEITEIIDDLHTSWLENLNQRLGIDAMP